MPPWITPQSTCDAWYKVLFDSWDIYDGGYSSWDWGQKTILGNFSSCIGSTPTHWRFQYYDQPDENGNEWHAWFVPLSSFPAISNMLSGAVLRSGSRVGAWEVSLLRLVGQVVFHVTETADILESQVNSSVITYSNNRLNPKCFLEMIGFRLKSSYA
jgi:hypothetical protein